MCSADRLTDGSVERAEHRHQCSKDRPVRTEHDDSVGIATRPGTRILVILMSAVRMHVSASIADGKTTENHRPTVVQAHCWSLARWYARTVALSRVPGQLVLELPPRHAHGRGESAVPATRADHVRRAHAGA